MSGCDSCVEYTQFEIAYLKADRQPIGLDERYELLEGMTQHAAICPECSERFVHLMSARQRRYGRTPAEVTAVSAGAWLMTQLRHLLGEAASVRSDVGSSLGAALSALRDAGLRLGEALQVPAPAELSMVRGEPTTGVSRGSSAGFAWVKLPAEKVLESGGWKPEAVLWMGERTLHLELTKQGDAPEGKESVPQCIVGGPSGYSIGPVQPVEVKRDGNRVTFLIAESAHEGGLYKRFGDTVWVLFYYPGATDTK